MIEFSSLSDKELLNYKQRLEYDVSKYNTIQNAKKTCANSAYGILGNEYARFYNIKLAEAITKSGQLAFKWTEKYINEFLNKLLKTENVDYIIAGDTDSFMLCLEKIVDQYLPEEKQKDSNKIATFLNKFCENVLQKITQQAYKDLQDYLKTPVQPLELKVETIAEKAIWTSKKRYTMNVKFADGILYHEPYLKIKGLEAIRSSTPECCRKKIKDCLKIIFNGTEKEVQNFIFEFKKEFLQMKPVDVAFPKTVNGLMTYRNDTDVYTKGTPIHVRGSLVYNYRLKEKGLLKKYETIKEGEKIKYLYLKVPNKIGENVIAFNDIIPKEFQLDGYIDYEKQFEKTFIDPMNSILHLIGWSAKKEKSFGKMFG